MIDLTTTTIKSGDLITAKLMMDLIDKLKEMDDRITSLESSKPDPNKLIITSLSISSPIRIGEELQVSGKNFGYNKGNLTVSFSDGSKSYSIEGFKTGSNDEKLIFNIPPISSVPTSGIIVTMNITNVNGSDSRLIAVLPPKQILIGNVDAVWSSTTPTTLLVGQAAAFKYVVTSRANLPASFKIVPTISVGDWQNKLLVLDNTMAIIPNSTIQLAPKQVQEINIQLPSIPATPSVGSFTLLVTATGDINGSDGPRTFVIGSPIEQPDPTISISFDFADPAASFDESKGIVSLAEGKSIDISLWAKFAAADTYLLTTSKTGTNWNIVLDDPASPLTIASADLVQPDGSALKNVVLTISATSGASASGTAQLSIKHQGQTKSSSILFTLSRVS
jgi:hypothetical protein